MKKQLIVCALALACLPVLAVPFEKLNFSQDINTNAMDAVNDKLIHDSAKNNVVLATQTNNVEDMVQRAESYSGTTTNTIVLLSEGDVRIKSEQRILLDTDELDEGGENVFINGKSLSRIVEDEVKRSVVETFNLETNPLWRKKITVVGDSEAQPYDTYPHFVAERNKMRIVNKARGGSGLVGGPESETALLPNYLKWIDADSDYILVHIGYNDSWDPEVDDDSTATNTFKGAWNVFLEGLALNYPRAKKAIVLPYYWNTNGGRDGRVAWMKTRCDKRKYEFFDGVQEYGFDPTNNPHYFANEGGTISPVHFSWHGHARASYAIENFLKTRVQISK